MSRETWSFALAAVAVGAERGPDGAWSAWRLALGGVAARPLVTGDLEMALAAARPHPASAYKAALLRGLAARAQERLGRSGS
jgi:CO/xanthine dehydrogenase FAD-binding subunit